MRRRLVIVAALVAAALVLIFSGAFDSVTDADEAKRLLRDSGAWGPLAFIALFVAVHCVALVVVPLILAAGAVWDRPAAIAICWLASVLAATAAFAIARALGSEWAEKRMPARIRKLERRLAERGLITLTLVRAVFYLPPPLDWLCGVSPDLRVRDFLIGTSIGVLPQVVFWVIAGDDGLRLLGDNPLIAGGLALVAVALLVTLRQRRRRKADASA